jgi:hypothetical protein
VFAKQHVGLTQAHINSRHEVKAMLRVVLLFLALLAMASLASGCTLIVVGKNASVSGSAAVAHTDDAGGSASDIRQVHVPSATHPPGARRAVLAPQNGYPRLVTYNRGATYAVRKSCQRDAVSVGTRRFEIFTIIFISLTSISSSVHHFECALSLCAPLSALAATYRFDHH